MQLSCIFVVCVYVDLDSFFANLISIFLSRLLFSVFVPTSSLFLPMELWLVIFPARGNFVWNEQQVKVNSEIDRGFFPKMLVVFSCDYGRIGQNFHLEVVAKGLKELSKCLTLNIQTQTHGVLSYVPCTRHIAGQHKFMHQIFNKPCGVKL